MEDCIFCKIDAWSNFEGAKEDIQTVFEKVKM